MGIKVAMANGQTYTAHGEDDVWTVRDASTGEVLGTVGQREVPAMDGPGMDTVWTDAVTGETIATALWRAVRYMATVAGRNVRGGVASVETLPEHAPVDDDRATATGDTRPNRYIVTDYPRGRALPARERVVVADTFTHALSVASGAGEDVVYSAPASGTVAASNRGAYAAFGYAVVETPGERARRGMPVDGPADVVLPALVNGATR